MEGYFLPIPSDGNVLLLFHHFLCVQYASSYISVGNEKRKDFLKYPVDIAKTDLAFMKFFGTGKIQNGIVSAFFE